MTNRLATFFQGSEKGVGGFYPSDHIIAVYPNMEAAEQAQRVLASTSTTPGDAISVTGKEVLQFAADHVVEKGLLGGLMREISGWLGTEEQYVEQDVEAAKKGAAFLAVYLPDHNQKMTIWKILEATHPIAGRYYASGGIEHLRGEG
jgi:hypothetical protein